MEELIILGNGFDISCGLKSRYADFYNYRYTPSFLDKIEDFYTNDSQSDTDINFWDVVLASQHIEGVLNADWKDIESLLTKYLELVYKHDTYLNKWFSHYEKPWEKDFSGKDPSISYEDHLTIVALARILHRQYRKYFSSEIGDKVQPQISVADVLMTELSKYEASFRKYLQQELKENKDYIYKCEDKINKIVKEDKSNLEASSPSLRFNILTFNYTTPFKKICKIKNVHGSLEDGNIIFGIDGFSDASKNFVKFTKTYRTLSMTKNHNEKLYSNELQTIKFYGHSLGEADYSYFQSVFDGIDLYGSSVKLIFYYSRFHDNEIDNIREDELQYERITELLKRYGESIENEHHGKNLMHKLILEGRISIVDL